MLLSATACGTSGPAGASAPGGLTVWTLQDSALNPVQTQQISAFNASQTTAKASIQTFVNDPYKQKLQTAIGSPRRARRIPELGRRQPRHLRAGRRTEPRTTPTTRHG